MSEHEHDQDEHGCHPIPDVGYYPKGTMAHRFDPKTRSYEFFTPEGKLACRAEAKGHGSDGRLYKCEMRPFQEQLIEAFLRDAENKKRSLPFDVDLVKMFKGQT